MSLTRLQLWLLSRFPEFKEERALGAALLRLRSLIQTPLCVLRKPSLRSLRIAWLCHQLTPRYTMVSPRLLFALYELVERTVRAGIQGKIVECGVWNGGSAAMIAAAVRDQNEHREFWLFDSFKGLPEPTERDPHAVREHYFRGWNTGDPAKVAEAWRRVGMPNALLNVRPGWFAESFPQAQIDAISVLHIDADWYESVRICLVTWYDRISPGGIVILNDYNQWSGCNQAVQDFIEARRLHIEIVPLGRVGAYFVKPSGNG